MMKKIQVLLIGAWCVCQFGFGQSVLPDSTFHTTFRYRVKQLDEFMSRFNGEESIDIHVADSLERLLNLLYLFNNELFAVNRDSMLRQANTFIRTVTDHQSKLYYEDDGWLAEVGCHCIYNGRKDTLTLYLKPEKIEEFQYRWVIIGAKGKLLRLIPARRNRGLDILPNNHEIAFRALSKIAQLGSNNILNYAEYDYSPDELSTFYALVYADALKIEATGQITYHFFEVPGYVFTVERFNREGNNTGWLISRLIPMNESEKQHYYDQFLTDRKP